MGSVLSAAALAAAATGALDLTRHPVAARPDDQRLHSSHPGAQSGQARERSKRVRRVTTMRNVPRSTSRRRKVLAARSTDSTLPSTSRTALA